MGVRAGEPPLRLIALYRQPADPQAFDPAYFETHLPLIAKVPGLQKTAVSRFTRTTMGMPSP